MGKIVTNFIEGLDGELGCHPQIKTDPLTKNPDKETHQVTREERSREPESKQNENEDLCSVENIPTGEE